MIKDVITLYEEHHLLARTDAACRPEGTMTTEGSDDNPSQGTPAMDIDTEIDETVLALLYLTQDRMARIGMHRRPSGH